MSEPEKLVCAACRHEIDPHARSCPFCGSDPRTGEKSAPKPGVEQILPKKRTSTTEKLATGFRSRSGLVFAISLVLAIVALVAASNWVSQRQRAASDSDPVPLTEVTDLAADSNDAESPPEMPELEFEYDGDADAMETFVIEEGEADAATSSAQN